MQFHPQVDSTVAPRATHPAPVPIKAMNIVMVRPPILTAR
jgi:hypothetical protein